MANSIKIDQIDIMVYLAGRFNGNRPEVAIYRPAPVQISFHDCATTGIEAIDYWLTDADLHPIETEELFIPHPDIINRKFVLVPFCELMPDYKIEKIGKTISELLNICPDQSQVVKHVMEKNA